tara:strand:+ start:1609 stop:1914 length:306 start_codon:yes stop_codon:yes gene_type:complete
MHHDTCGKNTIGMFVIIFACSLATNIILDAAKSNLFLLATLFACPGCVTIGAYNDNTEAEVVATVVVDNALTSIMKYLPLPTNIVEGDALFLPVLVLLFEW